MKKTTHSTATGVARFIGSKSKKKEDEEEKGKTSNESATAAGSARAPGGSAQGLSPLAAKKASAAARVKRSKTAEGMSLQRSMSPKRSSQAEDRSTSPGRQNPSVTGSHGELLAKPAAVSKYRRTHSLDHSPGQFVTGGKFMEQYKRQGTAATASLTTGIKSNTNLLDDDSDSDLSDPDETYQRHSSLGLLTETNPKPPLVAGSLSLGSLPSHSTPANMVSMPTTTCTTNFLEEQSVGSASIDFDDPMSAPSKYLKQYQESLLEQQSQQDATTASHSSAAAPPPTTGLERVVTVNLLGHSSEDISNSGRESPNQQSNQPGFFGRLVGTGTRRTNQPRLGSTALARFGRKYQVDQSVNLMDIENVAAKDARRQQMDMQKKRNPSNRSLNISPLDLGASPTFVQHQRRRQSFNFVKPPPKQTFCEKLRGCLFGSCGASGALLLMAMLGVAILVFSLVYDGSSMADSIHPTPAPTLQPTIKATTEPTQAPKAETTPEAMAEAELAMASSMAAIHQNHSPATIEDAKAHLSLADRERWEDLEGLITRHTVTPKEEFNDPNSSPYKALDWIIEYDAGMEHISNDETYLFLEVYALMVFYFSTHPKSEPRESHTVFLSTTVARSVGSIYDSNKDWIHHAAIPVCKWDGVHCGHLHRVITLNLTHHLLQGTLPKELVALEHLIELDLSHNQIGGTLPVVYGELDHLRVINMNNNRLEGKFPDEWATLASLETLDLSENPGLENVPDII